MWERVIRRGAGALCALFVMVGVAAAPASAERAVARFSVDPAGLRIPGVRVGEPVFRGHRDWLVFRVSGDLAALRRHRHVRWVERSPVFTRPPAARDTFPANPVATLAAPVRAPRAVRRETGPARATVAIPDAPTTCTGTGGLDAGKPDDPSFCREPAGPYYAEEWNNFCFTPDTQKVSVMAGAPAAPQAAGMCSQGAWAMGAQGQGTVIAILDSGVDYKHPDLAPQMADETNLPVLDDPAFPGTGADGKKHGWNFYDDNAETIDFYGHGTGRAGIAAAAADNGIQMAGVSPRSRILAVKVGDTYVVSGEAAAQGVVYAADHGADVINTSLGVVANSRLLRMAAVYAAGKGVFWAAATANEYSNHHNYPTNLDTVAGVTGLGPDQAQAQAQSCSNGQCAPATPQKTFLQKVNYANYGAIADFAAPVDTMSTGRCGTFTACGTTGMHASGTSTAAPHVAGAAALVRSAGFLADLCAGRQDVDGALTGRACAAGPALTQNEVFQLLAYTATRVHNDDADAGTNNYPPNPTQEPTAAGGEFYPQTSAGSPVLGWNQWSGYGRPNAYAAAAFARSGLVPPEVQLYGDSPPPSFGDLEGPVNYAVLTPEQTPKVDIVGHVASRPLPAGQQLAWKVQVAPCLEPSEDDFATIASGTGAKDGRLAEWTLPTTLGECAITGIGRPFSPKGTYTIRTIAYAVDGAGDPVPVVNPVTGRDPSGFETGGAPLYGQDRRVVTVRPTTADDRPGSPHYLGASGEGSPTLYDLEGRGELDVVLATGDGQIRALRPDGTDVAGWPVSIDDLATSGYVSHPAKVLGAVPRAQIVGSVAVGDIDGDAQPEVVASALTGGLYAWHRDGSRVAGFPVSVPPKPLHAAPADPYAPSTPMDPRWCSEPHPAVEQQRFSGYGSIAAPVLAELDATPDGRLDIVQAAGNGCVYVVSGDGAVERTLYPKTIAPSGNTPDTPTKIAATPAVGDFDGDGDDDIVVGTEEVTGTTPATEGRLYAYDGPTGTPLPGWPKSLASLAACGVPTVACGVISSPALFRTAATGPRQAITGIFLQGDPQTPVRTYRHDGANGTQLNTQSGGAGSNVTDLPFHWGVTQTAVGRLGAGNAMSIVTGGMGAFLAVDTATVPGKKPQFQHEVGAWDASTGQPLPTFPRQIEDWQFLSGPAIADVKGDGSHQVLAGSGEGYLHAFDPVPEDPSATTTNLSSSLSRYADLPEPAGFPVHTGFGYITSTPAVAQMERGGKVTVATVTRDGWLFLTETAGTPAGNDEWWKFHHDERNSGVHGLDTRPPATVDDLSADRRSATSAAVSWTAAGDDWWVGTPASVDLRWSTSPITDAGFGAATPVPGAPAHASGTAEEVLVSGLPASQTVHFALRATDDAGNVALIARGSVNLDGGAGATPTPTPTATATPTPTPSGPPGGGTAIGSQPCTLALSGVSARPRDGGRRLRLAFTASRPVTIDLFRETRGRKVVGRTRIARFAGRTSAATLARRLPDGAYVARFTAGEDSLRSAFASRRGRFVARPRFEVRDRCRTVRRLSAGRSVFGGRSATPLSVAVRLARPGRIGLTLERGGRVVRRVATDRPAGTATARFAVRPDGLRRGAYTLRLTVTAGGTRTVRTVVVRLI